MAGTNSRKPMALRTINFAIFGTGSPGWGDPRDVCTRQLPKHIVYLCRSAPMSAMEVAAKLHVAKVYVEEEMEILANGVNGQYGLLRRLDGGKYIINFVLLDHTQMKMAERIYTEHLAVVCDTIEQFVREHEEEYCSFPYLNYGKNKKVDFNLILWQQIHVIANAFAEHVDRILAERYFADVAERERPFTVYGSCGEWRGYALGMDGVYAENVCGMRRIHLVNIYNKYIRRHFECGWNVSLDVPLQLGLRAMDGLDSASLSDGEIERAREAVACGYLYRERERFYTKILAVDFSDRDRVFDISRRLTGGVFEEEAEYVAERMAALIRENLLEFLLPEWRYASRLVGVSMEDAVINELVERGLLVPPLNGIGAEGCWVCVDREIKGNERAEEKGE